MKYRMWVGGLFVSMLLSVGCASAPLEDGSSTSASAEPAGSAVSALQADALRNVARDLDAATVTIDQAAKEQNLDAETNQAWATARLGAWSSANLELGGAEGLSESALAQLRSRLAAFDPVLEKLEAHGASLHPSVQEAALRLAQSLDALEAIEQQEGTSALGEKGLRKRRCCMLYFPNGNIEECISLKMTKVGANAACLAAALHAVPGTQMTVETGKCGDQADCP